MNFSDDKKIEILLQALKERYESIHKIRDRVQTTGVWILGLLLGASGWIIQIEEALSVEKKLLFIMGALLAATIYHFLYLADLRRGFRSQQRASVKIEKALGLYEKKFFTDDESSLYEESWQRSGTKNSDGKFFYTTQWLLWIGVLFLVLSIWFNGVSSQKLQKMFHEHYKHSQHSCFFSR
jgi:multisubunit Na+/H+ antiporter MnhG subunit